MPCDSHPVAKVGYTGDEILYREPKTHTDMGSCCPVTQRPGYPPSHQAMNPCGGINIMTGQPTQGTGCGNPPGWQPQLNNPVDPNWCCNWGIIVSDIALKENITKVGNSPSGINIYEFDYKDKSYGDGRYRGVIAQEVPEASIKHEDGYLRVNYSDIDVNFEKVK